MRACEKVDRIKHLQRILGFAMRKQAKRCKAKPQQVSLSKSLLCERVQGRILGVYVTAARAKQSKIYRAKPNPLARN